MAHDPRLVAAARGGLCAGCRHAVAVPASSGAVYLRCAHPVPPKYPPMPVLRCPFVEGRSVGVCGGA